MLANWEDNFEGANTRPEADEAPVLTIPKGAGLRETGTLVAMQCIVSYWKGNISGMRYNACSGAFHRIEVARIVPLTTGWVEHGEVEFAFKRKPGPKRDAAGNPVDMVFRPRIRKAVLFKKTPPSGLRNAVPWMQAYNQVANGLAWAARECVKFKDEQYAVLLIGEIDGGREVTPENTRFDPFIEHRVMAVYGAEAVKLMPGEDLRAAWGGIIAHEDDNTNSVVSEQNSSELSDEDADLAGYGK